jgi:hypothetical protein
MYEQEGLSLPLNFLFLPLFTQTCDRSFYSFLDIAWLLVFLQSIALARHATVALKFHILAYIRCLRVDISMWRKSVKCAMLSSLRCAASKPWRIRVWLPQSLPPLPFRALIIWSQWRERKLAPYLAIYTLNIDLLVLLCVVWSLSIYCVNLKL